MATNPEIRAILERSYEQNDAGDKAAALALLAEARAIAVREKSREFLSEVENAYANHYCRHSDFGTELRHRRRTVALLGPKGHPLKLAIARSNLAGTLVAAGDFAEATKHLYRALDHYAGGLPDHTLVSASKHDEAKYLAHTLYTLANLSQNMRDFAAGKEYLKLQSDILRKHNLPADPDAYGLLLICHYETQDYEGAVHYAQLQLHEAISQRDPKAEAMAYSGLALAALKRGLIVEAKEHNRRALDIAHRIHDRVRIIELLCNEGEIAAHEREHDTSVKFLEDACARATEMGTNDLRERVHRVLSEVYEAKHDFQKALEHYKLAAQFKERLASSEQQHEISRMRVARIRRALATEKKILANKLKSNGSKSATAISVQRQLLQLAPTLSRTELKICELLSLGASTKEIAEKLCASRHTVDGHRTAIRKKLGIASEENLSTWLMRASVTGA